MIHTIRKCGVLIGPGQRGRWGVVVTLALAVSAFEAGGTLLVFGLLGLLVSEGEEAPLPVIGDVRGMLPALDHAQVMLVAGAVVAGFFLVRAVVVVGQAYVQARVAEKAGSRLSARLLAGYLAMPFNFHIRHNSAEMIRNTFDSVQHFVNYGLIPGARALSHAAIVVGVLVVLVVVSPALTLVAASVLGSALWLIFRVVNPRVERHGFTALAMAKETLTALQQNLAGVRDITLLGREQTFVSAYDRDRRQLARANYLFRTAAEVPRLGIETGIVLVMVALLSVFLATGDTVAEAGPTLGLFAYAAIRLIPEFHPITAGVSSLKYVGPAIDKLHDDLVLFAHESPPQGSEEPLPLTRELRLEGVSFTYPQAADPALVDIDLEIPVGTSIGIVGPTGGGKSTLVDLILGLLSPDEGRVVVDGVDIRSRLRAWQANLGVVPQMVFLIDDTVRRNVALGLPDEEIDEAAVEQAIRMAQLDEFVASLPDGLDTFVGERGARISGGQRQRLSIARALYRHPRVLIFDEGTSALDTETEAALMDALARLRGVHTVITVAHRLTTVQGCDLVVLLRDGRIVDRGPYAQLAVRHASLQLTAQPARPEGSPGTKPAGGTRP